MKEILEKQGGFVRAWFKPSVESERKVKDETKATVRCIPFDQPGGTGTCIFTGEETDTEVLFAVAY
jgi:prolyl-tRNA synthetase